MRGENRIDIAYELFGSTDFGETSRLAELNGMDSFALGTGGDPGRLVSNWEVQPTPRAVSGRALLAPQYEFYLSPAALRTAGGNRLTILLAYTDTAEVIRSLRVEPYGEDAAREVRVDYRW